MAIPPFDASKAVTFDLARGQLRIGDSARGIVVPVHVLERFSEAAGDETAILVWRMIGDAMGERAARRLGGVGKGARDASVESFIDHLAGELSIAGVGSLSGERWGRALLLVVDHCPLGSAGDQRIASLLSGAISTATSTDTRVVVLARDRDRARFLVTGAAGADKVRAWLGSGVGWGEALVLLHGTSSAGGAP
jgi:hypothetical protein